MKLKGEKILVTGGAGFIGFHLTRALIDKGYAVVSIDNVNDYYSQKLKFDRLEELGIDAEKAKDFNSCVVSSKYETLQFYRIDFAIKGDLIEIFEEHSFIQVCHLGAQAGVRYSLTNPDAYTESNILGFMNILECCRHYDVKHLVYASSSSVYGKNTDLPFKISDRVDEPISLYAATKKSNELLAHTYSHLYGFATTGLRFFTVYGPWGRPDMAIYLFADAISNNRPIKVFNNGNLERDFTYIDDIISGLEKIIIKGADSKKLYKLFNIGNNSSVRLLDFIGQLEVNLNKKAIKEYLPMQPGDVYKTWADTSELMAEFSYAPNTHISIGISKFVEWYKDYNRKEFEL